MIIRIFQVTTKEGKEEEFGEFFHSVAIPQMRGTAGIVQILPGAPRSDIPTEFSFVMIWKDLASLKAFVGDDYQSPHVDPAEAELFASRTIKHNELVELCTWRQKQHRKSFRQVGAMKPFWQAPYQMC